jgi:secreted PhoX family phosphatase
MEPSGGFASLAHSREDALLVPPGYAHDVVSRWGDPVLPGAPRFDPQAQTPAGQALQFGYNCDFLAFLPLPRFSGRSDGGLLVVNHEYTNCELMFPGWNGSLETKSRDMVDVELAAHGLTVIEIRRDAAGRWHRVSDSPYSRRVTGETVIAISGPAAGHAWLRTSYDPAGTRVRGTLNNCAGGVTPWGTVLTGEENVNFYFRGTAAAASIRALHARYGVRDEYGWGRYHDRFDLTREPREPLRFGWVVEVDPYDPNALPIKRTALGRFKHEAATVVVAPGGQAVVYSGDDERFEYLYKFVSTGRYQRDGDNRRLLDDGTLYVARFNDDGSGEWLPLVFGMGPLTEAHGFQSQAEVLINARGAADLLGATKMDRPEDVEASPQTGKVYAVMTNNASRIAGQVDRANPRAPNRFGHIIEISEAGGDHAATRCRWDIFIAAGNPADPAHLASYQGRSDGAWFATPDNIAFDARGRLWVATDGQAGAIGANDGLYMVETEGSGRGLARQFLSGPVGSEICGPVFTPDNRTLFVSVQHPGEAQGATFANPASRWPDGRPDMPPRPSVVAIYRPDGATIGS